jgi:polar amino acid transport system substrate-binding protein
MRGGEVGPRAERSEITHVCNPKRAAGDCAGEAASSKGKYLLLDSPSAPFLAVKTGGANGFNVDKPIVDFYEHANEGLMRLDVAGTPFAYVPHGAIFMKPGDFKWWLFLDTWVREFVMGPGMASIPNRTRNGCTRTSSPQRFYDFYKY